MEQITATNNELISKIAGFINAVGIKCIEGPVGEDPTFLPGVIVSNGTIVYDLDKIKYPGDLIHEAGHLAVLLPKDRPQASAENMAGDLTPPSAEMSAIAWSWAAMKHLDIEPEVLFHPHGYAGGSQSLITAFSEGKYIAVSMLQYLGMTREPKPDREVNEYTYPKMKYWLRQEHTPNGILV